MLLLISCKSSEEDIPVLTTEGTPLVKTSAVAATTIEFSDYTWTVKHSGTNTYGPGPNYWNKNNVWVDAQGRLHLKITKNIKNNRWNCAEIKSTQNFGYGTYQWKVDGPVNALDKNIVLGLFNYNGVDGFHEMDIEFARWGLNSNPILNYTVYPGQAGFPIYHNERNFPMSGGTYTTHRFIRTPTTVVHKSLYGFQDDDTNLFATETCSTPTFSPSTLEMPIHMNLWLFQGRAPSDNNELEIIIHSFKFTPN